MVLISIKFRHEFSLRVSEIIILYMHWEKIPLTDEDGKLGTRLIKEQLEDLSKQGIPFRFVRTKERDGTESISIENRYRYRYRENN